MADHFHDDPAWQEAYEIRARKYQEAGFTPAAQAAAMRAEPAFDGREAAFEKDFCSREGMSAEYAARLAKIGMIDDRGNMKNYYFEHLEAAGALDTARADFYARYKQTPAAHAATDHERGETFLDSLDAAIEASDGPQKVRLAAFKESIGDLHQEVGGADHPAAIGRDIRTASGFVAWEHTQELVGGLLNPDQQRRNDLEAADEERRRAGRGGGGNPANASHSFNIRPDVVAGPAGLEVRTTMKSVDYRANPDLKAELAEAERSPREDKQPPSRAPSVEPDRSADRPTLTLEAIERDPWNAVELPLPENPGEALLKAARSAADYCAEGEHELMVAAREGRYTPPGWNGAEGESDAHKYNEDRCLQADRRLGLINEQIDALEGRGVYAEASLAPEAPTLSDEERATHLETLRAYDPAASVYDVLETQLFESRETGAPRTVDAALRALLGNDYAWPQTFGEVLDHIDRGYTAADSRTVDQSQDAGRAAHSSEGSGDDALTPDQLRQRNNEESVKREDAERPARNAEDVPGEPALPATPSLEDDLRAAEKAAKIERESEGQESVTQDHGEGKAPGGGGGSGRGMF
jgi:hypothetical protein